MGYVVQSKANDVYGFATEFSTLGQLFPILVWGSLCLRMNNMLTAEAKACYWKIFF